MGYTTTEFLASVKRRATMAQASAQTFTNDQLYTLADEEIVSTLFPILNRVHQEFGVFVQDFPVQLNKIKYRIPPRAWGSKLRDVKYVDSAGNEQPMVQVFPDLAVNNQNVQTAQPYWYMLQANSLVLAATPNVAQGSIRMRFYVRPNQLINVQNSGTISSKTGQQIQVLSSNTTWQALDRYDGIKSSPGFEHVVLDAVPSVFSFDGINTYTMEFGSEVDLTDLEEGDYFNLAEQTPVPQLPADMHPTLYQRVVVKIQELQGDSQARAQAQEELLLMEENLKTLHAPRVESARIVMNQYLRDWLT